MPPTPSEMQERLETSRARLLAAFEGVEPQVIETEEVVGVWSPCDVAGNVIDWNRELLWAAQAAVNQQPVEHHPITDPEGFNQEKAARRKGASWADTQAELDTSFSDAVVFVGTLTPEQLEQDARAPWDSPAKVGELIADIAGHSDEHAAQLEAWRTTGERQ